MRRDATDDAAKALPLGGVRARSDRGSIEGWKASPHVAVFRWTGHAEGSFVAVVAKVARQLEKPIRIFHDLSALENYESDARTSITDLGIELLPFTETFEVYASSRIVRMGVSVISIPLLGKLVSHGSLASLYSALDVAVARDKGPANFSSLVSLRTNVRARD